MFRCELRLRKFFFKIVDCAEQRSLRIEKRQSCRVWKQRFFENRHCAADRDSEDFFSKSSISQHNEICKHQIRSSQRSMLIREDYIFQSRVCNLTNLIWIFDLIWLNISIKKQTFQSNECISSWTWWFLFLMLFVFVDSKWRTNHTIFLTLYIGSQQQSYGLQQQNFTIRKHSHL